MLWLSPVRSIRVPVGMVLYWEGRGVYVRMQYEGRLVLFVKALLHTIMESQFLIHIIAISLLGIRIPGRLRAPDIAGYIWFLANQ